MKVNLPWPPRELSPNSRAHWTKKASATAKYRRDCALVCMSAGIRRLDYLGWTGMHVHLVFCAPSRRSFDLDNALSRVKAGLDGVADATGIDDSLWTYAIERGTPCRDGAVILTVSARETAKTPEPIP